MIITLLVFLPLIGRVVGWAGGWGRLVGRLDESLRSLPLNSSQPHPRIGEFG